MGIEPFLISVTLEAVSGQRLVRSICPNCRANHQLNESLLAQLEISKCDIGDHNFSMAKVATCVTTPATKVVRRLERGRC
jgi:type II secretory ATPase GspE/PulE/Tfp pilus assembly ATPase PilB-like protein